jgi:alkylated DNA repair dioxygenase AlkB
MSRDIHNKLSVYRDCNFLMEEADEIYAALEAEIEYKTKTDKKRVNSIYGDDGVVYTVTFGGYNGKVEYVSKRVAKPWTELLKVLRDLVSTRTGEYYNVCVVQRYPNGEVGIKPHKDNEMGGNSIACLSFGAERTLVLTRYNESRSYRLPSGSLYVLEPPTNVYWLHSIVEDDTTTPRISLTFRYVSM